MPKTQPDPASSLGKNRDPSDGAAAGGDKLFSFAWWGPRRSPDERRADAGTPDMFDRLAKTAAPENWDGLGPGTAGSLAVLKNYVARVFDQALAQEAVILDADAQSCVFNTGLVSRRNEDIYGLFEANLRPDKQPWFLKGWRTAGVHQLSTFAELPEPPSYSADPYEYFFDWDVPLSFSAQIFSREISGLLPGAGQEMPYGLELALNAAVTSARTLAQRNPGTAVPMWHAQKREIQLLLPLYLVTPEVPTAALAVSRGDASYLGAGVLSLQKAYEAARLVARPSAHWLALRT
ncbi:DUF3825 domain-containing protein [Streptomyces sp. BE147]|uniref:DUF3825 domain-containing protein n=1 Tax=Streptomyces sp. BE147 TaxID=3002524 RepID=UPI002E7A8CDB|nr:DUF3825 domain-containing protein [Streptomyces sp. BE147]MEE1742271.1 DUF3825 domain-containing protein [Streptomyces sp. BE147]